MSEEEALFLAALKTVHSARPEYFDLNRRAVVIASDESAEEFCARIETEIFADESDWPEARRARYLEWAAAEEPVCKLSLVLAARAALAQKDPDRALKHARMALTLIQNSVHIQSLFRQALGILDENLEGSFCRAPFEDLETAPNGDIYFCCPAWLPVPIGNLNQDGVDDIWNSPTAQEIRTSIHDGSYRYCSRVHCPKFAAHSFEPKVSIDGAAMQAISDEKIRKLRVGPRRVVLSHDRSCNLSCPSCRSELILARKPEQARMNELADQVLFPLLKDARRVRLTASGDPFGSAHFQYVLRNLDRTENPLLKVDLQTNGLLLTPELWERLQLEGKVVQLLVSIDAATPETYAIVRRGGRFETLLENFVFLAKLRREGRISTLRLDFVVQADNFREMPGFVSLARRFGADSVKFQMIRNWGSWSVEEFQLHDISNRAHPEYTALLEVLSEPRLQSPYVHLWGMDAALRDAKIRAAKQGSSLVGAC